MKTILLDTNLLLLLVVGLASRNYIDKHKRLKEFTESDYDLLLTLLGQASSIRFAPNTLTETSNLINHINESDRSNIYRKFAEIISKFDETYIQSRIGAQQNEFVRLGLTDSILLLLSDDTSMVLVTTDFHLYQAAMERGLSVVNFNHHRDFPDPLG